MLACLLPLLLPARGKQKLSSICLILPSSENQSIHSGRSTTNHPTADPPAREEKDRRRDITRVDPNCTFSPNLNREASFPHLTAIFERLEGQGFEERMDDDVSWFATFAGLFHEHGIPFLGILAAMVMAACPFPLRD